MVAVLLAMVVLSLVVFGVVGGGTRDHELAGLRVQSTNAFYAAEAATNMSLAEIYNNTDADGDGTIGTISNDGDAANDPALGTAQFNVTSVSSASGRRFSAQGRAGGVLSQREFWVTSLASAAFADGFESYASDTALHNVGGWMGWDNSKGAAGYATNSLARSGANSIDIRSTSDPVHLHTQTSGTWTYTAYQYIPSSATGTDTYFILMNTYAAEGSKSWSTQIRFVLTSNVVYDNMTGSVTGNQLKLQRDRWVPIVVQINLDNGTQTATYDGNLLFTGSWNRQGGALRLAALDLYDSTVSHVYYDDITLVQTTPTTKIVEWTPVAPTP